MILAAFCGLWLTACTSSATADKANQPVPAQSPVATGPWLLIVPPLEGYSSDRTPQMGAPLALPSDWESRTGAGYKFVDVERMETNAPLDKWQKRHSYETQGDCEDYRAAKLKEFSDPKATTKLAVGQRDRIVDPIFLRDLVNSSRCVSADQLGPH